MPRREYKEQQSYIDENTLLLLTGDDFTDRSVYNNTVNVIGGVTVDNDGVYGGRYKFTDGKLQIDIGDLKVTDGIFTLEFWCQFSEFANRGSYNCIYDFCNHKVCNSTYDPYYQRLDNSVNGAAVWGSVGSFMRKDTEKLFTLTDMRHFAWVGSFDRNRIYIDGKLVTGGNYDNCTNKMNMDNGLITIGNINLTGYNRQFKGYLEEIRFSNVARYTENFTPKSLR